jgi:hypothetical protein
MKQQLAVVSPKLMRELQSLRLQQREQLTAAKRRQQQTRDHNDSFNTPLVISELRLGTSRGRYLALLRLCRAYGETFYCETGELPQAIANALQRSLSRSQGGGRRAEAHRLRVIQVLDEMRELGLAVDPLLRGAPPGARLTLMEPSGVPGSTSSPLNASGSLRV